MSDTVKKLTGWHVLFIFLGAFAVVLGVNGYMISQAVKSYPGLEVQDSYVASQGFDDKRSAQLALHWDVQATYTDDHIAFTIVDGEGKTVHPTTITAQIGRPTTANFDKEVAIVFVDDHFEINEKLDQGQWHLMLNMIASDGTPFKQTRVIIVN